MFTNANLITKPPGYSKHKTTQTSCVLYNQSLEMIVHPDSFQLAFNISLAP